MSARIRVAVREELVGWTLATIADLFHAEGFAADPDCTPNVGGERRRYVEQFYAAVDWTDWDQVRRMLRVVESVLDSLRRREIVDAAYAEAIADSRQQIERLLARDGYFIDDRGAIRPSWEVLTQDSVVNLPEASAIPGHLRRMWDAVEDRPEQAISAAKDAIESAAKHALQVLGIEMTGKEKLPNLIDKAHRALRLHPTTVAPDAKGAEVIVATLGSLATIAYKLDELRNLYGDGHGRPTLIGGLTSRHSRFAARCADAYIGMLLDTLDAPRAPWRLVSEDSPD